MNWKEVSEQLVKVLSTSGFVALVTVALGGWGGTCITAAVQSGTQRRAFQEDWLKTRSALALKSREDYITRGTAITDSVYRQLGTLIGAADTYAQVLGWDPRRYRGNDSLSMVAQRGTCRKSYNALSAAWICDRTRLGLELDYYNGSRDDSVYVAWRGVVASVDSVDLALNALFMADNRDGGVAQVGYARSRRGNEIAIAGLSAALRSRREYLWWGWDNPESLMKHLGIK